MFRHEGRTWYSAHRGRLWIAAAAKVASTEEITALEQHYRVLINGRNFFFVSKLIGRFEEKLILSLIILRIR